MHSLMKRKQLLLKLARFVFKDFSLSHTHTLFKIYLLRICMWIFSWVDLEFNSVGVRGK